MILLIDNFDSFTNNIYHYALQCGLDCRLYRNDEISMEEINFLDPEGFIFSPGPKRPINHPLMFKILEQYATSKPILGICLGYQAIAEYFGSNLVKAPVPSHGKTSEIQHDGTGLFKGLPSPLMVARYHSLVISDIPENEIEITSYTTTGLPMSLKHRKYPLLGTQFHPEAILTEHGLEMMKNWSLGLTKIQSF